MPHPYGFLSLGGPDGRYTPVFAVHMTAPGVGTVFVLFVRFQSQRHRKHYIAF